IQRPRSPTLLPYTTLFRSEGEKGCRKKNAQGAGQDHPHCGRPVSVAAHQSHRSAESLVPARDLLRGKRQSARQAGGVPAWWSRRSEEHTSELQSRENLVCR